jgi:tetratricopeptide (TPR) repeat protein
MNKFIKILFITAFASLLAGCSIWYDFSTYFNIYYNTKDAFTQAEKLIYAQKRSVFSNEELLIPGNASQLLTKVNEKCSKILQYHKKSSYVENALMMLGKTFYYQKNYLKSLRKFQELKITQPDEDIELETDLWIGKAQIALKSYDKSLPVLTKLIDDAQKAKNKKIEQNAYIELVKYYMLKNEKLTAIDYINKFVAAGNDDEIKAEAIYEKGRLYIDLNDNKNAIAAFEEIYKYSPSFEVEVNSKLALGKAYREQGENDKALGLFESMSVQNKYKDKKDFIELEIATTYITLGRAKDAMVMLTKVDTGYTNSPNSSIARYKKGELYENEFSNYDSAATYYLKALNSNPPKDYLPLAQQKDQLFKKYKQLANVINDNARLKSYYLDSTAFIRDSLKYVDSIKVLVEIDKRKSWEDSLGSANKQPGTNQQGNINMNVHPEVIKPQRPTIPLDSIDRVLVKNEFDLANLFFTELQRPDSAKKYYIDILDEYKGLGYEARTLYALGSYYLTVKDSVKADSLFEIVYEKFSNESIANAAAIALNKPLIENTRDKTKVAYYEAEKELKAKKYQSAVDKFYKIYTADPKSPYAAQSLYAAGYILENDLRKPDSAAAVYDTLTVHYSSTVYGQKIQQKIITYRQEKERIKKAFEDSVKAVQQKKIDSLAAVQKKADSLKTAEKKITDTTITNKVLTKDELIADSIKNVRSKLKNKIDSLKKSTSGDSLKTNSNSVAPVDSTIKKDSVKVENPPPGGGSGNKGNNQNGSPKGNEQGIQNPPNLPPNNRGKRK